MNKYSVLFAVMLFILPSIGVVAALDDIKCAWEPCGTKVEQCTDGAATEDAVYALVIPGVTPGTVSMALAFFDANGNGAFDSGECAYIDVDAGGANPGPLPGPGVNLVQPGDIRLTGSCGSNPNTPVLACADEVGTPLTYMPAARPQNVVGFVDIDNSGYYSLVDPLYLDTNGDGLVSQDDIRLTGRTDGVMNFQPYSVVQMSDFDITSNPNALLDLVGAPLVPSLIDMNDLLGFVDTSCDNMWDNREKLALGQPTGEDKLYIQQMVLVAAPAAGVLDPFEDFVTIGDFRLYMPPNEDCWPDCGTKVEQCDSDATYPMLIPGTGATLTGQPNPAMNLVWVDKGIIGQFEADQDSVYIDTDPGPLTIAAGDVRLTPNCGCEANTVVGVCGWCDIGDTSAVMPQDLVGFVDVNGNGRYDLGDPLYLDTSSINAVGIGFVSVNDLRLTGRTDSGMNYGPYTPVMQGHTDISLNPTGLQDLMAPHGGLVTPINTLLGFVDSQCDGFWDTEGTDKLYLQQMVFPLVQGVPGVNQFDRFTTIGDFRLYMPTDEACWPDCGTKVEQCDVDATYGLLTPGCATQDGAIPAMDIRVSTEGCVYVDTNIGGPARVDVGDIRLSACCGEDPNTAVKDCDCDYDRPFAAFPGPADQNTLLGYVDVNDNDIYDIEDALYLNLDQIGIGADSSVSPGDLRLTGRTDAGMNYLPYTFVVVGDDDEGNTLRTPKNNIPLPGFVSAADPGSYLGFIDSNCDGRWDPMGSDELYLQQMVPEPFHLPIQEPQFNAFSTIGDFRLYVMPDGTGGQSVCPWDLSGDGNVDINDVLLMIPHWGTNWSPGDFNTDGKIDINDVLLMIPHWGPCP